MNWIESIFDRLNLYQARKMGVFSYLIVFALMCMALLVRLTVAPLDAGLQYLTFFPAVTLTAILFGFWPGLFAVFIGMCMATYIFVPPYYTFSLAALHTALWSNMVFLVDGFVVCSAVAAMHRYQDKLNRVIKDSKRIRLIIESTSDAYWLCDLNGKILDVNYSFCRMSGFLRQELLQMHILDLAELPDVVVVHLRWVIEHGCDVFETRYRDKNGTLIELEISASFIKEHGAYINFFARDISERKRIEAEMIQTHAELEDLYENAPCGYHSLGVDGTIIQVNQTELDWLGYTREEMLGKKIIDFQTPLSAKEFKSNYPTFKRDGYIQNIEVEMFRKDGTILSLLLSANTVNDADGNFVMSRTSLIDITSRKLVEIELRDSESRFRQLFEKAPIGIAIAKRDQLLFSVNPAFCKLFGYSQDELSHLTIADLTHPDDVALTRKMVDGVLGGTLPEYFMDKQYLRKNGEKFWGRAVATELSVGGADMRYIMGMVEDITDRVAREAIRVAEVLEQRDVLVREVHHRIKNNLQGVVGLLRQSAIDYPDLQAVIDKVIGKIYSIAIIHGLQASTLTEKVNLHDLIKSIINASCSNIVYEHQGNQPAFLSLEEAVPIALVLNELLTNACKHRADNTPANIRFEMKGDDALITIRNLFDSDRDTVATGKEQGLNLVRSLLPRKSAYMAVVHTRDSYMVELKLSPPVTMPLSS